MIRDLSRHAMADCSIEVPCSSGTPPVQLAVEHHIEVLINEKNAMLLTCSPMNLDELVVGRLLSEGLISSCDEIVSLYICEQGLRASVLLNGTASRSLQAVDLQAVSTCCTDNRVLLTSQQELSPVQGDLRLSCGKVASFASRLYEGLPLYEATHAVHSCGLADDTGILCQREDLGRHNALDKVIGYALLNHIDLGRCAAFTTGRMPVDMVSKAIRAGIPILISKTWPTELAVTMAEQFDLTLVTLSKNGHFSVWSHPERIL